jgi:rubrerythrin
MPQPINPDYPIPEASSIDQLMGLAVAMEHEAASRYRQLAEEMTAFGDDSLADLFRRLAELESRHENGLVRWAEREGRPRPEPARVAWRMPETFGDAADGEALVLTPYRALTIAVHNEERAFAFYTYLAAMATKPEVQARAEALAREELAHVAELRIFRRRAYHDQRPAHRPQPRSLAELRAAARRLEEGCHEVDLLAAQALSRDGHATAALALERVAQVDEGRWRELPDRPAGHAGTAVDAARAAGLLSPGSLTALGLLRLALRNAEEVLEIYLQAAEHPDDEAMQQEAQRLSEDAVARLAVIRAQLTGPET